MRLVLVIIAALLASLVVLSPIAVVAQEELRLVPEGENPGVGEPIRLVPIGENSNGGEPIALIAGEPTNLSVAQVELENAPPENVQEHTVPDNLPPENLPPENASLENLPPAENFEPDAQLPPLSLATVSLTTAPEPDGAVRLVAASELGDGSAVRLVAAPELSGGSALRLVPAPDLPPENVGNLRLVVENEENS